MIYRRYISPTEGGFHIVDISSGTDFTDRSRSLPPSPLDSSPGMPLSFPCSCRLSEACASVLGAYTHAGGEYDTRLLCCLSDFVLNYR